MNNATSPSTALLRVDQRYSGRHGIGRYAAEVLSRLPIPWEPLGLTGRPGAPLDLFRALPRLPEHALIYSPGYAGFLRSTCPQVLTIHDLIHLRVDWPGRAKYAAYYNGPLRRIVRRTGIVLTVSESSKAAIAEWLGDDSVRIVNAGNGCSDEFRPYGPATVSNEPYALYVGNLRAHKNLDVVLRALTLNPALNLKAVLPSAEIAAARQRVEALGITARVDLIHGIEDLELAMLYRGATATVMPSTLEGFGLPPLESIRCGTPVAYWAGCPAVAETVGDRGWAVDQADDPRQWSETLATAFAESRRIEPPTESAHDWSRIAETVSRTLTDLDRA